MVKCPVCKLKYLVGGHKIYRQKNRPKEWFEYLNLTLQVSKNRLGRMELVSQL
ncbi:hypothetical protein LCGC14_1711130 [marine sediment metagenome]|uniref:Uncharacterized protein n=1 Tax=marine sediment metagenome TaxID=412755 RepID=A0A0F9HER1_9ZZZZ